MKNKWVEALEVNYSYEGIRILTDDQKALKKKMMILGIIW
jgi:hypothetical protein